MMNTKTTSLTPTQTAEELGTCGSTATVEAKESQQTGHTRYQLTPSEAAFQAVNWLRSFAKPCSAQDMADILEVAVGQYERTIEELLEALKSVMPLIDSPLASWPETDKAKAAISKAEGKQNE